MEKLVEERDIAVYELESLYTWATGYMYFNAAPESIVKQLIGSSVFEEALSILVRIWKLDKELGR